MARLSQIFNLGLGQGELDFVDVDAATDTPLFVDSRAIWQIPSEWAEEGVAAIEDFDRELIASVQEGNRARGLELLQGLREPNETRLGFSSGRPRGSGLGPGLAHRIWRSMATSTTVAEGLIRGFDETALVVPGVGIDRVSDMTTNLLRRKLISYTQQVCRQFGIPVQQASSGMLWSIERKRWTQRTTALPVVSGRPVLLVPKALVRQHASYDPGAYYRYYILNHLVDVEYDDPESQIVGRRADGAPHVNKKDIETKYRPEIPDKKLSERVTRENPDVLESFREDRARDPQPPLTHAMLAGATKSDPPDWDSLIAILRAIPPGNAGASDFQHAIEALLNALFWPWLTTPRLEYPIIGGLKRVDIRYSNMARDGFFKTLTLNYPPAMYIFVECKNYTNDPANPEVDQIAGRLNNTRGRFGLLVCRQFVDRERLIDRCRSFAPEGKLILPLDDSDLAHMVDLRKVGDTQALEEFLMMRFGDVLS